MTREDVERLMHCARHEAQGAGPNTLDWEHEGDEESGQHDEDCRACEYEAMPVRFEAALADEEPKPDPAPSACSLCGVGGGKHKPDCSRPPAPSAIPEFHGCPRCGAFGPGRSRET